MFLGNNICYHINLVDSSININTTTLLNELNKLENIPTFKDYIEIFNKQLIENVSYKSIYLESFINFESIGKLSILGDEEHTKNNMFFFYERRNFYWLKYKKIIKEKRINKKIILKLLSNSTDISISTLCNIENGKNKNIS